MYLNRLGSSSSAALRSHHITWTSERRWAIPATFMHQECSGMLKPAEAARVVGKLHFWFARRRVRFWRNSGSVHTSPCLLTDVWKRRSEEWWMQREEAKRVSVWFFSWPGKDKNSERLWMISTGVLFPSFTVDVLSLDVLHLYLLLSFILFHLSHLKLG